MRDGRRGEGRLSNEGGAEGMRDGRRGEGRLSNEGGQRG